MHNFASISRGRSRVQGLELFRVWDVDEDAAYQIKRIWDSWEGPGSTMPVKGRAGLCAARTLSGEGWIETEDGVRRRLGADSLVILPWDRLSGWGTVGSAWRFVWFEFFPEDPSSCVVDEPVTIRITGSEREDIDAAQRRLRSPHESARQSASAHFVLLLYYWLEHASTGGAGLQSHAGIERAIDLMHNSVDRRVSVPEMAGAAGLGVRAFSTAFEQVTGQTPKRYHLNLRLDAARALLLSGRSNVKQAAEQLGFSSPFYLSKLYSKRYGHPPSRAH